MKQIKLLVWKSGYLNLSFWIIGIAIWLLLIIYLFNIGNDYMTHVQFGVGIITLLILLVIILQNIGIITIKKNEKLFDVELKFLKETVEVNKVEEYDLWWNYNYTMFTGDSEVKGGQGAAFQLALWISIRLIDGRRITIREILPNWSSTPKHWKYNVKSFNDSKYKLSTLGLRKLKRKLEYPTFIKE